MISDADRTVTTTHHAPVTLSAAAAARVRELMVDKGMAGSGLRVFVQGGGCSGLQYGMAFVTEPEDDDQVFDSEGIRIHVDPVSIQYIAGAHVDFQPSPTGGAFRIDNPNATACAGCAHTGGCGGTSDGDDEDGS